jgi:hypothetical protein
LEALREGLERVADVTAERVNGKVSDFFLSFVVQTTDDEVLEYELAGGAAGEGVACVRAYQLGARLGEEIGLTNIVAVTMQDEMWLRNRTTNRITSEALVTVGVVCTGERLAVAQEISRDANGVMSLGAAQPSYNGGKSPVMDAFITGLDSTREVTTQRWLA